MSNANYIFFTLLNPAQGGTARKRAVFNRVEVISNLALLTKKN